MVQLERQIIKESIAVIVESAVLREVGCQK